MDEKTLEWLNSMFQYPPYTSKDSRASTFKVRLFNIEAEHAHWQDLFRGQRCLVTIQE